MTRTRHLRIAVVVAVAVFVSTVVAVVVEPDGSIQVMVMEAFKGDLHLRICLFTLLSFEICVFMDFLLRMTFPYPQFPLVLILFPGTKFC